MAPSQSSGLVISGAILLLVAVVATGRYPSPALAHNDYCAPQAGVWQCSWSDPDLAITTPHWFNADVKRHAWSYVAISDGRGGAVAQKCVHAMRDADGYLEPEICGPGIKDGFVKPYMRPGYIYTRYDDSPRTRITGEGMHD